jgi:hypothetical protein
LNGEAARPGAIAQEATGEACNIALLEPAFCNFKPIWRSQKIVVKEGAKTSPMSCVKETPVIQDA